MAVDPDPNDRWPDNDSGDESASPGEGRTFFSTWGWPLFGLAAFVIFELTASLMWSSLVFALRFGWKDSHAGWFLWRKDPVALRGRALGLLHLAAGTSNVFWMGLLLTIVFAILAGFQGRQAGGELAKSSVLMLGVFFIGMFCCGMLTLSAAWISWRSRIKFWVDSSSYPATLRGEWPPRDWTGNRCSRICIYAMVPVTAFIILLIVPLLFLWSMFGGGPEVAGLAIGLTAPMVGGFVYLVGVEKLVQIVAAHSPQECWPELVNSDEIDESDLMRE